MRPTGLQHPTGTIPVSPDFVNTLIITTAGAAVAFDWPQRDTIAGSSASSVASGTAGSSANNPGIVMFGGNVSFFFDPKTAGAVVPTTNNFAGTGVELNPTARQVPGDSTGGSVAGISSGYVTMAYYKK